MEDIIPRIISNLELLSDIINLTYICKSFHNGVYLPSVWKSLFERFFYTDKKTQNWHESYKYVHKRYKQLERQCIIFNTADYVHDKWKNAKVEYTYRPTNNFTNYVSIPESVIASIRRGDVIRSQLYELLFIDNQYFKLTSGMMEGYCEYGILQNIIHIDHYPFMYWRQLHPNSKLLMRELNERLVGSKMKQLYDNLIVMSTNKATSWFLHREIKYLVDIDNQSAISINDVLRYKLLNDCIVTTDIPDLNDNSTYPQMYRKIIITYKE